MRKINIAIDGPAGAGKSTIAKLLSKKLDALYLDTGAMYRTVALKAIRSGIATTDGEKLSKMIESIDIDIKYEDGAQVILLDGENVNSLIRTPEVSVGASNVAVVPAVRLKMVEIQRQIAKTNSVVMDGRDIGSYVLPNADLKLFLTASVDKRSERRCKELLDKGITADFENVRKDIEYRDKNDSSREFAPLKVADDAIIIDTTNITIDECIEQVLNLSRRIE